MIRWINDHDKDVSNNDKDVSNNPLFCILSDLDTVYNSSIWLIQIDWTDQINEL